MYMRVLPPAGQIWKDYDVEEKDDLAKEHEKFQGNILMHIHRVGWEAVRISCGGV